MARGCVRDALADNAPMVGNVKVAALDWIVWLEAEVARLNADTERLQKHASMWKTRTYAMQARVAELEGFVESLRNRLAAKDAGYPVRGKAL